MLTYVLVALGLSMDAFAVSVSSGICVRDLKLRHALRASLVFGLFQFAMPVAGWLLGSTFRSLIQGFDHWLAFGLLAAVGGKMLFEALRAEEPEACPDGEGRGGILEWRTLLVLAVATSIDALAVGISYSMLRSPILLPSLVIGAVTFALCLVGTEFGKHIGSRFERWAEIAGGVVLVGLGGKILLEHLLAGAGR